MSYLNIITWRDVSSYLYLRIYLFTTELRHLYFQNIILVTHMCYISNGRRFTKSTLCILLLSTFCVSSINYSLVCIAFRFIHEAQLTQRNSIKHTVSWNRAKCCTDVRRVAFGKASNRWMTFKVIQGHCRCCHLISHIRFPISLPL